MQSVSKLC